MSFALRVKTKSGQEVIRSLTFENTIKDLKVQLSNISNISENRLHVLYGFPPKALDISQNSLPLSESGLKSGDTLILGEKAPPPDEAARAPPPLQNIQDQINADVPGILMKKVVPADNSCLFSSIHFALNGKLDETGTSAPHMRQIIAEAIRSDPVTYSEVLLQKSNADYCAWILDDKSWGGAIELSILSTHFGFEIAVVDTINAIINRFGEDQNYGSRIFLMFDGIHYDPLFLETPTGEVRTIFDSTEDKILSQAEELAQEANSSRQFTDVDKFTLKCMICNMYLSGQLQAREHAQSTGHTNFGEV